jgi:hypothetical protein
MGENLTMNAWVSSMRRFRKFDHYLQEQVLNVSNQQEVLKAFSLRRI